MSTATHFAQLSSKIDNHYGPKKEDDVEVRKLQDSIPTILEDLRDASYIGTLYIGFPYS